MSTHQAGPQEISDRINRSYKQKFVQRTEDLIQRKAKESHSFLEASLIFNEGSISWRGIDFSWNDSLKIFEGSPSEEIPVRSTTHAYELFMEHFTTTWFSRLDKPYQKGIKDLEKYCNS